MARKIRLEFPGAFSHASNRWLTEHLQMGTPVAVSQYVRTFCQLTEKLKA